ncbi:MAG: 50S ribosomal protein L29 [Ignavibacteria bacterium]|jgi:large subunit ribosomal protein L29|nr:MAG: 50S ribosomal protein L29 [Ignavibacteria bacterium]
MKIHEVREMKTEEIIRQIEEEERNLVDLRFAHQVKELTNTAKLNLLKKDIARMKTILKERAGKEKEEIKEGESV